MKAIAYTFGLLLATAAPLAQAADPPGDPGRGANAAAAYVEPRPGCHPDPAKCRRPLQTRQRAGERPAAAPTATKSCPTGYPPHRSVRRRC